jgi:threonine aldolase
MVSFESDYTTGAHPRLLRRLVETNREPLPGYGADPYSARAKEKIRAAVGMEDAEVEFLAGGTQTNAVVISAMLSDCEGVIAAQTGHVSAHEAGAIEYTGHKVLTLPQEDGKIRPETLARYLADFFSDENRGHMVFPGMAYVSHPTEYGTLYAKSELEAISEICGRYGITLYLDGARLGCGLMSRAADLTLPDIARLCGVFSIGGTKVGALCGEAVVFTRHNEPARFLTSVKKRGALLAKGRLLGVQFDALFTDGLYFRISRHAVDMAERMKALFAARGFRFFVDSPTNQQFVILENGYMERLAEKIGFCRWEKYDADHTVVRFAASWSTTEEDLAALERALESV